MQNKSNNKDKGTEGEEIAMRYLIQQGYEIVTMNWKFDRAEVDIIAQTPDRIVFVEVKLRYSDSYGDPWEAVNHKKRKQIIKAADAFIIQQDIEKEVRFDIISILKRGSKEEITHLEDAFWPTA